MFRLIRRNGIRVCEMFPTIVIRTQRLTENLHALLFPQFEKLLTLPPIDCLQAFNIRGESYRLKPRSRAASGQPLQVVRAIRIRR